MVTRPCDMPIYGNWTMWYAGHNPNYEPSADPNITTISLVYKLAALVCPGKPLISLSQALEGASHKKGENANSQARICLSHVLSWSPTMVLT